MADKDKMLKKFFGHREIFADLVNVLLFDGEQVVKPEELEKADTETQYAGNKQMHSQYRDGSWYWVRNGKIIARFSPEHMIEPLWWMPVRIFSYDGVSYREEFNRDDIEAGRRTIENPGYAVISFVVSYSLERWEYSQSLNEVMKVPDFLRPFAPDYQMILFELAYLPEEKAAKFRTDLWIMTDYLRQKAQNNTYVPVDRKIMEKEDFFNAMSAITDQDWLSREVEEMIRKGEEISMVDAYAEIREEARNEGIQIGRSQMSDAYKEIREEARNEGIQIGKSEGFINGKFEGESLNRKEIAMRMLKAGKLSLEDISAYTGLSMDEVKDLQKNILN